MKTMTRWLTYDLIPKIPLLILLLWEAIYPNVLLAHRQYSLVCLSKSLFWFYPSVSFLFRVFVNRSLAMEKIKCFGFDMDYTLAGKCTTVAALAVNTSLLCVCPQPTVTTLQCRLNSNLVDIATSCRPYWFLLQCLLTKYTGSEQGLTCHSISPDQTHWGLGGLGVVGRRTGEV